MKNNIGRKLTSLTLMTIMFAGGMTAAVPSIMPGIFAEGASSPGGLVSVSSSALQGASIMEIVIDDAAISALDTAIGLPTVTFSGGATSTLNPYQATDGKWYAYIVDDAASTTADALSGLNFGIDCTGATTLLTLKDGSGKSLNVSGSALDFWWLGGEHGCHNPDGPASEGNIITNKGQVSANPNNEVLNDAPTPNRNSNANNGQIYAVVNSTSGTENGLWPFVQQVTMGSDNTVSYGGETVGFSYGNQNGDIDVSFDPDTYANGADINLIINDIGLNIDPTISDIWVFGALTTTGSETTKRSFANGTTGSDISGSLSTIGMGAADFVSASGNTGSFCVSATVEESGDATGVFSTPNVNGASDCDTSATATNHHTATYAYGGASANIHIAYHGGSITMDAGDAWMPAEAATVTINDPDANRTNGYDEALSMETLNSATTVPYIKMGSPLYLGQTGTPTFTVEEDENTVCADSAAASSGDLGIYELTMTACGEAHTSLQVTVHHDVTLATITNKTGTIVMNYDVSSFFDKLNGSSMTISLGNFNTDTTNTPGSDLIMNVTSGASDSVGSGVGVTTLPCCEGAAGNNAIETDSNSDGEGVNVKFLISHPSTTLAANVFPVAVDFFNFNSTSGIADAIYRLEAEEDGTDGVFTGTVSYATMVHEGNSTNATSVISTNSDEITLLLAGDKTGASAPRVLYGDKDENNDASTIGAQLDANTHTGVVTFDAASYGTSSIVHVTVTDPDLNQDSGARESYSQEREVGTTANAGDTFAVSYNDTITSIANLRLVETGNDTGVFVGQFLTSSGNIGNDLKLTYYDNKDASGTTVDTYASVKIATESGTISFDRQVYPVPFFNGWLTDGSGDTLDDPFDTSPSPTAGETHGNVTVYFTVSDGDEVGTSISGAADRVYIKLNGNVIATAGATSADLTSGETGALSEVEQGTSVYEGSFSLDHQETAYDTVAGACTTSSCAAFNVTSGMVLQAAYDDQTDDGGSNTVFFDSATVDLRTGSISTDKEVYVIGSDIVVTITDPDLNLDSDSSESYSTKLAEWDSSASSSRLLSNTEFAANPSKFIETGSNTGVFQTVFSFPSSISSTSIEQGEEVTLTYRDQGLSGKDAVHDDYSDQETTIYASNFGAIVELDRAIYDWTDRVLITVTAPDHNKDSEKVENIGTTALPVKVSTRQETFPSGSTSYTLAETSEDSGVFTGEYVLKGFGDGNIFSTAQTADSATGSTDGVINTAGQTDGITVSYEYTDGSVSLASALIAWNIGEISFSDSSVSPGGSTVVTLIDGDLDKNPDVIDTKTANVFSDSDSGGISITLHETGEATGTFETTVFFTADDKSTGSLLRVSEGDTVTVEYTDQSLPEPYEQSDTLTFAATTTVGTVYPPLERAPASNARVVDAFGSQVSEVSADQQVQIAADVSNGTGKDQSFAYLVQVQDANGVTVSLAWITGALTSGQSMSPALSWTPSASGSYTATVFVWQSVDNPTALSPTVSVNIDVV